MLRSTERVGPKHRHTKPLSTCDRRVHPAITTNPTTMDIHDPSIPQTTTAADDAAPTTRESVLALIHQKDDIESELKALGSVLDSHKVNMKTSLTTFDGFPRDDVDIAQSPSRHSHPSPPQSR